MYICGGVTFFSVFLFSLFVNEAGICGTGQVWTVGWLDSLTVGRFGGMFGRFGGTVCWTVCSDLSRTIHKHYISRGINC